MNLSGYLNDPYKVVPIGPADATENVPESRPSARSRRAVVLKYSHAFDSDSSINVLYRFYNDDWSITANTIDITYNQKFGPDWIVSPEIRFYTQTGAYFFANRFLVPQTYMSADYRLSPFGSFMGGLTITHRLYDSISANLGVTILSQQSNDPIRLASSSSEERGSTSISAADMNVTTITFGLRWLY
jgi:hypothetical protein